MTVHSVLVPQYAAQATQAQHERTMCIEIQVKFDLVHATGCLVHLAGMCRWWSEYISMHCKERRLCCLLCTWMPQHRLSHFLGVPQGLLHPRRIRTKASPSAHEASDAGGQEAPERHTCEQHAHYQ